MGDTWIVNASPIITLAKVDRLDLLADQASQVWIPEAVAMEVRSGPESDSGRRALEGGWGLVVGYPLCPRRFWLGVSDRERAR